jgi:alpha-mannosidase
MHDDRSIVLSRLERVTRERIRPARFARRVPLDIEAWEVPGEPCTLNDALNATYQPFSAGSLWGKPWGTTWFRARGEAPPEWAGSTVVAAIDLGFSGMAGFQCEGLVYQQRNGEWLPLRGLHPFQHRLPLGVATTEGIFVDFLVEAASNPVLVEHRPDPNSDLLTARTTPIYRFATAELAELNVDVDELLVDISVLKSLLGVLDQHQPRYFEILRALETMLDALSLNDIVGTAPQARATLTEVLSRRANASAHRISAIGHAHIDSAWLWPIRETKRKCARTFSNVLALMDADPAFKFACSQAVQYDWIEHSQPALFEKIRERVAEGRWIPVGGMWVEADTNLAGGEALLRQFLYGQRYFEERFGVTCSEVWIPDVFGYPASLPQLMKLAGIDRFLTQKLSWNKTNRFPHHTFWWEGIDGSSVFTHFPPVETYNATMRPNELDHAVRTFTDKGVATRSLMPFGYGDGGGGPSPDMMARYHRVADLEGLPRVTIESPQEFFDAAIEEYPDAERWVGELYFEMHRGTFTSQAKTKRGNRRCEHLLREAELWASVCSISEADESDRRAAFPSRAQFEAWWKVLLLHQFHDILPGSSIGWVHREAEVAYDALERDLTAAIESMVATLSNGVVSIANPAPHRVEGVVICDSDAPVDDMRVQRLSDGSHAASVDIAALSISPFAPRVERDIVLTSPRTLENAVLRVELDDTGSIISLFDKRAERELVVAGERANVLHLLEDFPNEYDAWDLEEFSLRQATELTAVESIRVEDDGPLVGRISVVRRFGASSVTQRLELRAGSPELRVDLAIDWYHQDHMLKVAFPLDIAATEATREVQFGSIRTAIHTNTSWDDARFEVCAHRWVDVGEVGYGVSLLNDSKYGHEFQRIRTEDDRPATLMRLSLLRGPQYPDPTADQGHHSCSYVLRPRTEELSVSGVTAAAYRLNAPVRLIEPIDRIDPPRPAASSESFEHSDQAGTAPRAILESSAPNVIIDTIKPAEDESGDLVVRCYESVGARTTVQLTASDEIAEIWRVDLFEKAVEPPRHEKFVTGGSTVQCVVGPFEIVSLRLSPR